MFPEKPLTRGGKVKLSVPFLGMNWGKTRNPYLAIPLNNKVAVKVYVTVRSGNENNSSINLSAPGLHGILHDKLSHTLSIITEFYHKITDTNAGSVGFSIDVRMEDTSYSPLVSIYTSVISLAAYLIFKSSGYTLDLDDLMEILQAAWKRENVPENFIALYSSLVMSSFRNRTVLYRDYDEFLELSNISLTLTNKGKFLESYPNDLTDILGPETASALAKLEGVSLIEAMNRLSMALEEPEETDVFAALYPYIRIENALYYLIYGVMPLMNRCKYIQSLNGVIEEICVAG